MKILLVTALLLASTAVVPLLGDSDNTTIDYRLPNNTVPISYTISLIPYIVVDNFTYNGESTIELQVLDSSSSITLHILALTIDESSTSLVSSDNANYEIANHTYDTTRDFLILNFATILPTGNYTLYLKYVGILDGSILYGFYRSSYTDDDGETVWLATTQFEATSARRAFPCWDEPALKATFTISIKHDVNYTAISNMPVANQSSIDTADNKLWTNFEITPIMSTYLVAFVVSDYGYVSNENETFRVWTRKDALQKVAYALTVAEAAIAYLEEYTTIPCPVPKIDQVTIPEISDNGMENWGIVTYSYESLIYDKNVNTTGEKEDATLLITHELAHHWFGDLVTVNAWKYLWLNEGFATYFQYAIVDQIMDNWRGMEQFVIQGLQESAFITDSVASTHPINQDVSSPTEIDGIFDGIIYNKGASLVYMMSHFLTPVGLHAGLIKYLNNHAYGGVTTDDLWSALQEASDEGKILQIDVFVKTIMDTWVEQSGYPVVTVTRNYTTEAATISQERYFQSGASDDGTRWWIPINYATELDPDFSSTIASDWIRQEDYSIVISGFESTRWVIFNIQRSGYYRVNYDETNWKLLAAYLDSEDYEKIHFLNRAQLIHDSHYLARANRISFSVFLDISVYLHRETDYIAWGPMIIALIFLNPSLANTESHPLFQKYILERLETTVAALGYDDRVDDVHVDPYLRYLVLTWSCNYGSEECRSKATAKLAAYLEDPIANPISPDLTAWAKCAGLRSASASVWNKVLDLYVQNPSSTILGYLGCSEDEEILETYLTLASTDNTSILKNDAFTAYASVYNGSPKNINLALDYLINNFERLYTFWNGSTSTITSILTGLGGKITTSEQLQKLGALIKEQSDLLGSLGDPAITSAKSNIEWADTYEPTFRQWLNNFYEQEV